MFNTIMQTDKKLYKKIVKQIEKLLANGTLLPGDKLPSEKEIAKKTMTSRASVREALCALKILGVVDSERGKGNFIKTKK
jgi:GntR family transcriptional repressor for pyruvate dehydrogenase complex